MVTDMLSYLPGQLCKLCLVAADDPLAELSVLRDAALRLVPENQVAPDPLLDAPAGGHHVLEENHKFQF